MTRTLADHLLRPERVAIIGASADPKKNNSRPQRYLVKHGFRGEVYPINPNAREILGRPAYASVKDCPAAPDHAYIMVGARSVEAAVRECGEAGVKVATIFSGGFAEGGEEGRARQARLVASAREQGLRLIGPNSLGVFNTHWPLTLSANAVLERERLPKGRTGLVSQSGSMIGALVSRGEARNIAFSSLVSIGNECDLSVGEIADMLVDDPDTDVILLFLETVRDAPALRRMAYRAAEARKPVLAYTLARSDLGRALAQSHTGAMIGSGRALDAFLADCGIMRVDLFETLLEAPALVRGRTPPQGCRVAIATTTGGAAALVADRLGEKGIEVLVPRPELVKALATHNLEIAEAPIVDLTMAGTRPEVVDTVMSGFLADDRVDAILMAVGSSAEYFPKLVVSPLAKWAGAKKPIVAFLLPSADHSLRLLSEAGIPGFRTPEACADALAAYLSWRAPLQIEAAPLPGTVAGQLAAIRRQGKADECEALGLLGALGVPVPAMRTITRPEQARTLEIAYPVVAKILSADIAHKSDVGGVVVAISGPEALESAVRRLLEEVPRKAPGARIGGVVVQEMAKGLGEAIVGFRRDPLVGPVVVVGVGGVLAEVYGDAAVRPAPVDLAVAREMIAEVKGFAPLRGFRGLPQGDLEALAAIVVALSRLALDVEATLAEAEINPVIVRAAGAIAVDGLLVPSAVAPSGRARQPR